MSPEELERWIVPCAERLGAEPCDAMHFAADVRGRVESMMDETIEACAKVADQWEDSTQDIDCGVTMVSVLKSGRPDTDGGIVIQEVDKLEPWEQRQAEMLGEYREVARREERRIVAAAIRQRKGAR